jgi:hypothetical protein
LHVASVACSAPEPPTYSLMPPPSSTVASWRRSLCLFLPALASSSSPWTVVLGDASPPLLGAGRNHVALAWWVATAHRSLAALLGAPTNVWRVVAVSCYARNFWSYLPTSPWGRDWISFIHQARHSSGSMCIAQVTLLPDALIGVPRAHCVGLAVVAKLGGRSWSAVVESFLSRIASHQDLAG